MIMGRKEYDLFKISKIRELFRNLIYIKNNDVLYNMQIVIREHKLVLRTWKWIEA